MKNIYKLILGSLSLVLVTACDSDLDLTPSNTAESETLTDYTGFLNSAYFYQLGAVTPMAVMGDFRADNAMMDEEPFPAFDRFNSDLTDMEDQFFGPFYTAMYRSILSANNVIENSSINTQIGEAQFLRALSYFKLVQMFGDVGVQLVTSPDPEDQSILVRQPVADVYTNVIIPDLMNAISILDVEIVDGRASRYAAQALLGKVYITIGDFTLAETQLAAVVNGASTAGIELEPDFADVFGVVNDLNSEIIFATQVSNSIIDEYEESDFWTWSVGQETKAPNPLDIDLIAAFDASEAAAGTIDLRRAVTIDEDILASPKFPQEGGGDHDWIELRLADVMLLYAEALNENGATSVVSLAETNAVRTRAGLPLLDPLVLNTPALVRQAIYDERRLELAFEGQRWFDLVRTGTAEAELGVSIDPNYLLAPIPLSEVLVSGGVITQNPGY